MQDPATKPDETPKTADQAQRLVALWQYPLLADHVIPEVLQVPRAVWCEYKRRGDTPPLFELGRRLFAKTDDLKAWLDRKAANGRPGSKRLRNAAKVA